MFSACFLFLLVGAEGGGGGREAEAWLLLFNSAVNKTCNNESVK